MKLKIEIDMGNAAMQDNPAAEVKWSIDEAMRKLEFNGHKESVKLFDTNGNSIGTVRIV